MIELLSDSPWPIKCEWLRQAAWELLDGLNPYLPDLLYPWRVALHNRQIEPDHLISQVGRSLARSFSQYEQRIAELERQVKLANMRTKILSGNDQETAHEPLQELYRESQDVIQWVSSDFEKMLVNLHAVQKQLAAEQSAHQREAAELRAYIQAQNRIIAQQQLRLNQILGETPGAETPGTP